MWYINRYGECAANCEKWAMKEAHDPEGNRWTEKWTENQQRNHCFKSGANARGDEWDETWEEYFQNGGEYNKQPK